MQRVWEGARKGWESRLTGKQGDKERRLSGSIWTATPLPHLRKVQQSLRGP